MMKNLYVVTSFGSISTADLDYTQGNCTFTSEALAEALEKEVKFPVTGKRVKGLLLFRQSIEFEQKRLNRN